MKRFFLKTLVGVFLVFLCSSCIFLPAFAGHADLSEEDMNFFNENYIYNYNPCGQASSSGSSAPGLISGTDNETKIWNYFVSANIPGLSNNASVIAGIMGNMQQESGFDPYKKSDNNKYYGLIQWSKTEFPELIDQITALGDYWNTPKETSKAPTDINDQALKIELDYLTSMPRFQNFLNDLSKTDNVNGEAGAESYSDLFEVIVEKAVGGSDTIKDSYAQQIAESSHYQDAKTRRENAVAIYKKYSNNMTPINVTVDGTGNFDNIMNAKNADKQYSDFDPPGAAWNDADTESMKFLLETYGDLAYQLGQAVGAPYIAILVQMRYEDPHSVCGKNNFWGNGCPPNTPPGNAKIQGKNLGEGFQQYGKTLTNGYHDQALGITDPIEYLEKIGPTWVQGNVNGAGYGSIAGMRNSVRALQEYINTPEGQAIVSQFGNYSNPEYTLDSNCSVSPSSGPGATNVGEAANIPREEREAWLFPDGVPSSSDEMQKYLTTYQVPILDADGNVTSMPFTSHVNLKDEYLAAFQDMVNAGFRTTQTYSYSWRNISGSKKLSRHSYGAAVDINWDKNPLVKDTTTFQPNSSDPEIIDEEIIKIWRAHGFYWGGCFSSYTDIMHFDYIDKGGSDRYEICTTE